MLYLYVDFKIDIKVAMLWFKATTWMSILFLGVHIFIYTSMKKLRDQPSQNLLALTVALFPIQLILTVDGLTYSR